jgi:hypothetical protein
MVSRRQFMGKVGTGAALLCVAGASRLSAAMGGGGVNDTSNPQTCGAAGEGKPSVHTAVAQAPEILPPWELLQPLTVGSVLACGWRLQGLTGIADGSFIITLRSKAGHPQQVRVCRNDGHPEGIVHTPQFDLLVMNGGKGDLPTREGVAQAVAQVARVMAAHEAHRMERAGLVGLLSHQECMHFASVSAGRRVS